MGDVARQIEERVWRAMDGHGLPPPHTCEDKESLPRTFALGMLPGTFAVCRLAPEAARAGRALVLVLRVLGCVDLLALAAVVMPRAWMARGHAWVGLGELPPGPLVGYLCRSASLLYALHGATVLFVSSDLPRYGRLVTFLAAAAVVHGAVMLGIDLAEGMPPWWTAVEGPAFAATGAAVLVLQWRARR